MIKYFNTALRTQLVESGYMNKHQLIRTVVSGLGGFSSALPKETRDDIMDAFRGKLSLSLASAINRKTGKINDGTLPAVASMIYMQALQSMGHEKFDALGISRKKIMEVLWAKGLVTVENMDSDFAVKLKNLLKSITNARTIDAVWKVIPKSITDIGIGKGVSAYEVHPERQEIHWRERVGISGESRYTNEWRVPKGEKGLVLYINSLLGEKCKQHTGGVRSGYKELWNRSRSVKIDRRNIFGLSRHNVSQALIACGLDGVKAGYISTIESKELVKAMVAFMKRGFCLSSECIDQGTKRIFDEHMAALMASTAKRDYEKIRKELEASYAVAVKEIKDISEQAVQILFADKGRKRGCSDMLERMKMTGLDILVNGADSLQVFKTIVRY